MDTENTIYSPFTFEELIERTGCTFEGIVVLKYGNKYYRIIDNNSQGVVFQVQKNILSFDEFKRAFMAFVFNNNKTLVGILINGSKRIIYETTVKDGTKFKDFETIGICRSEAEFNIRKDLLGIEL